MERMWRNLHLGLKQSHFSRVQAVPINRMYMRNVLVVEDFADFSAALKGLLISKYNVEICATLSDARAHLDTKPVDLVLLDLDLPDGSGLELCSYISQNELTKDIPILILSGKGDPHVKVAGLNLGADDFMDKPIRSEELLARIQAHLRRSTARKLSAQIVGDFHIDENLHKIFVFDHGVRMDLQFSPVEFRIFTRMLQHPGILYSRDQLISLVSGTSHHVSDRSIDSHVYAIRKKMGPRREQLKTIRGIGYMIDLQGGIVNPSHPAKNSVS